MFGGKFYQTGEKKQSVWENERRARRTDGKGKKSCWKNFMNAFFTPLGSHQDRRKTNSKTPALHRNMEDDNLHYCSAPAIVAGRSPIRTYPDHSLSWLDQNQGYQRPCHSYLNSNASYNDLNQLNQTTETSYQNPTIMGKNSSSRRCTPFPSHLPHSSPSYHSSSPNLHVQELYYHRDHQHARTFYQPYCELSHYK